MGVKSKGSRDEINNINISLLNYNNFTLTQSEGHVKIPLPFVLEIYNPKMRPIPSKDTVLHKIIIISSSKPL